MWMLNSSKRSSVEWNLPLNNGMGLLVKHRLEVICSNLYTRIYLCIIKGYPSHSLVLVIISNHKFISQLLTTLAIRSHTSIYFKFYPIVTLDKGLYVLIYIDYVLFILRLTLVNKIGYSWNYIWHKLEASLFFTHPVPSMALE